MKDRFWIFVLITMFLTLAMSALFIPERYVFQMIHDERQANYTFLGYDAARHTESRAERWFTSLFVKSGMVDASYRATQSDPASQPKELAKVNEALEGALSWSEGRIRVIWASIFQFFVRVSVALMWIPLTVLILVPFMVDSLVSRKIKASSFAITSPHLQAFGARSIFWLTLGYLVLQILPLKLHPVWTPLFIGLVSASMWLGISQFAKRA